MKTLEKGLSMRTPFRTPQMYMNCWCSALESHQSGGGITCINDRAFEGVCGRPRKVVGKYYKIGKNKKVYVVIKPIISIALYFRTYKETAVKRRKSGVKKYIPCLFIFHN